MFKGKDEIDAHKVQDNNIFAPQQPTKVEARSAPNIFDRKLVTSDETKSTFSNQVSFQDVFEWEHCIF